MYKPTQRGNNSKSSVAGGIPVTRSLINLLDRAHARVFPLGVSAHDPPSLRLFAPRCYWLSGFLFATPFILFALIAGPPPRRRSLPAARGRRLLARGYEIPGRLPVIPLVMPWFGFIPVLDNTFNFSNGDIRPMALRRSPDGKRAMLFLRFM